MRQKMMDLVKGSMLLLVFSLLLAACNLPTAGPSESDLILTHVAQTISVNQTIQAATLMVTEPTPGGPEATPSPTSETPLPTPTPTPTPTNTVPAGPCDQASFVEDVTYPPNSEVEAGEDFVKTWRVTNTGTCTWDSAYALEYVAGEDMDAPLSVPLAQTVVPSETADVTVIFTAPTAEGSYTGFWALVNPEGERVPMENLPDGNLKVLVEVNTLDEVAYDFAANYCRADWESLVYPDLPCPGDPQARGRGYVLRLDGGELESGLDVTDPILVTRPDNGDTDGFILGTFPPFVIEDGDHFMATIGCAPDGYQCNIYFDLKYQIGAGAIQTLDSWHQTHDNDVDDISVDLSDLAGQTVRLILSVRNINNDVHNEGHWYEPRVMR
jgi:hypothetical protein